MASCLSLSRSLSRLSLSRLTSRSFSSCAQAEAYYEEDQLSMKKTVRKIVEDDINPFVDQWEKEEAYPAHQVRTLTKTE